jgi:HAD superfamily hydrolase (TIGR01509 family)
MPIRAVIFDFGGVLLHTRDHSAQRRWEARLGLPEAWLSRELWETPVSLEALVGQARPEEVWHSLGLRFGLSAEELAELRRDLVVSGMLDLELVDCLRGLRPRYRTAILSNAWLDAREEFVQRHGLGDVVDTIIISAEEGIKKPDERIFQIAAERLGVRPVEALLVDDAWQNIAAAHAIGMPGVVFADTAQAMAEIHAVLAARQRQG